MKRGEKVAPLRLTDIAKEIATYLRRFEQEENAEHKDDRTYIGTYYLPYAYQGGRFVRVKYISYQLAFSLTRDEAMRYLRWLRAGNRGRHDEMCAEC